MDPDELAVELTAEQIETMRASLKDSLCEIHAKSEMPGQGKTWTSAAEVVTAIRQLQDSCMKDLIRQEDARAMRVIMEAAGTSEDLIRAQLVRLRLIDDEPMDTVALRSAIDAAKASR